MILLICYILESDYGYIYDIYGVKVFVFKPYSSRKNIISTDTSAKFTSILLESVKDRLKSSKPYTVFVYPRAKFKIDGIKYEADMVEGIPEGIHTVEIPGYVKAKINFKDYDVFVFITKVPEEYKEKPKEEGKRIEETWEKTRVYRRGETEFYITEGAGMVCGVAGGCAGCILGGAIGSSINFPLLPVLLGVLGFYGGYTVCKDYAKKSCVGY